MESDLRPVTTIVDAGAAVSWAAIRWTTVSRYASCVCGASSAVLPVLTFISESGGRKFEAILAALVSLRIVSLCLVVSAFSVVPVLRVAHRGTQGKFSNDFWRARASARDAGPRLLIQKLRKLVSGNRLFVRRIVLGHV
jgi:hypothetical protein